jgi:large subunit ribosomal protein L29
METIKDLRQMSDEQLTLTVKSASESLFRLRLAKATERLDVPSELRGNRRLIARCKTLLSERRIAAASKELVSK